VKDFLRGTLGLLLQWALGIVGVVLLIFSAMSTRVSSNSNVYLILAIICFASIGGLKYYLRRR
jgi:uncharacterized membrane-anchored protein